MDPENDNENVEPEQTQEPEATVVPAEPSHQEPPAPAPLTRGDITSAFVDALRTVQPQAPPPAEETPWGKDLASYWLHNGDLPDTERARFLHERVTKAAEHIAEGKVKALRDQVNNLLGSVSVINALKADNPEISALKQDAFSLLQSGKVADLETALELARYRKKPSEATPVPPAVASSPSPKKATPSTGTKKKAYSQNPVRDIIEEAKQEGLFKY